MIAADAITIVIPAHNGLEYSRICLESLRHNTPHGVRLVLVDNGSSDGTTDFFHSIAGARVVRHGENLGFAAGVNAGLKHATGHALVLNNDTYLPPGWLEPMVAVLESEKRIGLVGPVSNHVSGAQLIDGLTLPDTATIDAYAAQRAQEKGAASRDTTRLVGFCLLIRDTVLADVGLFDERFGIGNFEDDDYCRRALDAGYTLRIADGSFVYHFGHRTFLALNFSSDDFDALLGENAEKYARKWRMDLNETGYPQSKALYLHDQAIALQSDGDVHGALSALLAAVKIYPSFARAHNDLGAVLWKTGEHDRAFVCFERALRLCPDYGEARANLNDAAAFLTRQDEAEHLLREIDGD